MNNGPKIEELAKIKQDQIPGGLIQLRQDFINATTVPQLKAVLAKILKILLGV